MKTNSGIRLAALLLAVVLLIGVTACAAPVAEDDTAGGFEVGDVVALPDNNGLPTGDKVKAKKDPEKDLKLYGEIETLVKSVKTPSKPETKDTGNATRYGTVDWSTAANGYITFTARGQERGFILEGPNTGVQSDFTVAKDDSVKVALVDGTGKYQYAIANNTNGGKSYRIMYKNSFTVDKIDADLAPFLVSTPWGDYENAPNAVKKAAELWDGKKTDLENVEAISEWVGGLKYDKKLKHGTIDIYVNPDDVIERGGGVCNDMSKLLVAMLRSRGVPAYYQSGVSSAGTNHAWVCAWVELGSSAKDGITCSRGAWITIEATSGDIQHKISVDNNYKTDTKNLAN